MLASPLNMLNVRTSSTLAVNGGDGSEAADLERVLLESMNVHVQCRPEISVPKNACEMSTRKLRTHVCVK